MTGLLEVGKVDEWIVTKKLVSGSRANGVKEAAKNLDG